MSMGDFYDNMCVYCMWVGKGIYKLEVELITMEIRVR